MAFILKKLFEPVQKLNALIDRGCSKLAHKTSPQLRAKIAKYDPAIRLGLIVGGIASFIVVGPATVGIFIIAQDLYLRYAATCREIGDNNKLFADAPNAPVATKAGSNNSFSNAPNLGAEFDVKSKKEKTIEKAANAPNNKLKT